MLRRARFLSFVILICITGGCIGRPIFTVEVYATPTPQGMASDPFFPTMEAQPNPPTAVSPVVGETVMPTFTPAGAAMPRNFSPILYGIKYDANTFFLLLGGVQDGVWLTPEQAAANLNGTTEYDVYTSAGRNFQVLGYAPESTPIRPGQYTISTDIGVDDFGMVGVAHTWPVRQVQADELSPDNELYRNIVKDWLTEAGIADPQPKYMDIFRVDLEGDGTDEIFITAASLDDSQPAPKDGDYSVVLMRKIVGNEAVTLPLAADINLPGEKELIYPRLYSLAGFMDLDQDDVMEVVVDYHRWEENGAMVYIIHGQEIARVP